MTPVKPEAIPMVLVVDVVLSSYFPFHLAGRIGARPLGAKTLSPALVHISYFELFFV